MSKTIKRLLSMALALVMILSMVPTGIFHNHVHAEESSENPVATKGLSLQYEFGDDTLDAETRISSHLTQETSEASGSTVTTSTSKNIATVVSWYNDHKNNMIGKSNLRMMGGSGGTTDCAERYIALRLTGLKDEDAWYTMTTITSAGASNLGYSAVYILPGDTTVDELNGYVVEEEGPFSSLQMDSMFLVSQSAVTSTKYAHYTSDSFGTTYHRNVQITADMVDENNSVIAVFVPLNVANKCYFDALYLDEMVAPQPVEQERCAYTYNTAYSGVPVDSSNRFTAFGYQLGDFRYHAASTNMLQTPSSGYLVFQGNDYANNGWVALEFNVPESAIYDVTINEGRHVASDIYIVPVDHSKIVSTHTNTNKNADGDVVYTVDFPQQFASYSCSETGTGDHGVRDFVKGLEGSEYYLGKTSGVTGKGGSHTFEDRELKKGNYYIIFKQADESSTLQYLFSGMTLQKEHTPVDVEGKDATCTEPGLSAGTKCSECGEVLTAQTEIPAKNHNYGAWTDAGDGNHKKVCANDASHVLTEAHTYGEWDNGVQTCTKCSAENVCTHSWDEGKETTAPGCETEGEMTYTCKTCGSTKTEKISATEHAYPDTWTDAGDGNHKKVCANDASHVLTEAHTYGEWDNGTKTCTKCSATLSCTHNYDAVVTAPNCTDKGYTTHTCSVCGDSYVDTYVDALGHKYDNACDTTCNICDAVREVEDHVYDNACDTTCNVCGDVREITHTFINKVAPEYLKDEATYNSDAVYFKSCSVCGKKGDETFVDVGSMLQGAVASVNGVKYGSLLEALVAANSGDCKEIKLLADVSFAQGEYIPASGLTLDLNGHIVTTGKQAGWIRGENVIVKNGTIDSNGWSYGLWIGGGNSTNNNIVIENVTVIGGINILSASNVTLRNCTVSGGNYYAVWADYAVSGVVIESGSYSSAQAAVNAVDADAITTVGGNYSSDISAYCENGKHASKVGEVYTIHAIANDGGKVTKEPTYNETGIKTYSCSVCGKVLDTEVIPVKADPAAEVNGTKYGTLADAIAAAKSGETIKLLADVAVTGIVVVPEGVVLDLNGNTTSGTVLGKIKINDGNYITAEDYKMIGANADYYYTTDAVLTITGATGDITIHSGEVTLVPALWYTGVGQTLTIGEDAKFIIPAGKALYVNESTVVIDGEVVLDGIIRLTDNATVTYADGTLVEKFVPVSAETVIYKEGKYIAHNHTEDAGTVTTEPTLNTTGVMTYKCTVCGEVLRTEVIDKLPGAVAQVGETLYGTLAEAIAAADEGATVEILKDIALSEVVLLSKDITINGNGKTITSSASRIFRITAAAEVTMNDLKMVSTAKGTITTDARGISLDNVAGGSVLTLNDCSVDFTYSEDWAYAVNISDGNNNSVINVKDGTYEGANVINVWGNGHEINISDATLNSAYRLTLDWHGTGIKAEGENVTVNVTNTTVTGDNAVAVAGAATVNGTVNDETRMPVCSANGEFYYAHVEGETVVENVVDATCTATGSYDNVVYCSVCGEELSRETITVDALGHSYDAVVTPPELNEPGYTTYTCSVCGHSYVADEVPALKGEASIGNTGYESLEAAIAAAQPGDVIVLNEDVEASAIITIDKAITIDGNGKKLTSTASRAINIDTTGNVVISDLTIEAKGERAVNIINKPATVELNNVTATAKNNAVMIATTAGAANVTIANSDLTGLAVVNVAGAGAQVEIENTKITNVDATDKEAYGAITVWSSAENAKVTVTGGEIVVADDSKAGYVFPATAEIEGVADVGYIVALVGDAGFDTLQEAIDYAAEKGGVVELIRDVETSEVLMINGNVTINGNDHTITSSARRIFRISAAGADVEINDLNMVATAAGSDIRGISIDVEADGAKLTVNDSTITGACYAINNGGADNCVINVNGGEFDGLNVININGTNNTINVDGAVLNVEYPMEVNHYGVGVWADGEGNVLNVKDTTINGENAHAYGDKTVNVTENNVVDNTQRPVAMIGNRYFYSLEAAAAAAQSGNTIKLIESVETAFTQIPAGVTLDLNGKTVSGTVLGKIAVNGGDIITADDYHIVGGENAAYLTENATFIVAADGITVVSGDVTLGWSMNTESGHKLVLESGATFTIPAGKTLIVNGQLIANGQVVNNGTLQIVGYVKGDIAGTFKMAGGTFETGSATTDGYVMIGKDQGKYTSIDANFTVAADGTYNMTVNSGTITLNAADWWTLAGQTLTIAENAKFIIPADHNINVQGDVIVNGAVEIEGTVTLYNDNATVTYKDDSLLENFVAYVGHKVIYDGQKYVIHYHSYTTETTDPTCTEQGYTTYTCGCGDSYVSDYVAAKGHSFGDWYTVNEATCTADGLEQRDCANCDHYETNVLPATGHSYVPAVTAPTCEDQGYTTYVCSACGDTYVADEVPALGHTYEAVVTPPQVNVQGYTTYTCSVCGDSYVSDYVDALKVVAYIGDVFYGSVQEAIDAAQDGETVYLNTNFSENRLNLYEGVTLDLNGCTLTVAKQVTAYGEIKGEGLLVAPQNKVVLKGQISALPVWNGTGYYFAAAPQMHQVGVYSGTFKCLPILSDDVAALFAAGTADDAGLHIVVTLTYELSGKTFTMEYEVTEETTKAVFSGTDVIGLIIEEDFQNLTYTAKVVSDTGAEFSAETVS